MLRLLLILAVFLPAPALADVKAIYADDSFSYGYPIEVADNGDLRATTEYGTELLVRGGTAHVTEQRLTGPIVSRAEDLVAFWREQARNPPEPDSTAIQKVSIVKGETGITDGRSVTAYYIRYENGSLSERPILVMGDDPALRPLGPAMAQVLRVKMEKHAASRRIWERQQALVEALMLPIMEGGVPLEVAYLKLVWTSQAPIAPERFTIPAEPETIPALRARLTAKAKAEESLLPPRDEADIKSALFAEGRLWLLTELGSLSSLAEQDSKRRHEEVGGYALDMCIGPEGPILLTANGETGRTWTLRPRRGARWEDGPRTTRKRDEDLVTLACDGTRALVVTTRRIVTLFPSTREMPLSGEGLRHALVRPAVHLKKDHLFLGLNAGEWGGGLQRIHLETGKVTSLERKASGTLCGGPLNTDCDPVQGIETPPWHPDCVVAAVGLIHMAAHGRIVEICGDRIEQTYAKRASNIPLEALPPDKRGFDFDSVAFFGLVRVGDTLVAAGHDGLYRFRGPGEPDFQPLPRFREVDGVLVSFALPDAVLLITTINQRASMGGGAPMIVPR